jgi:hypothetical protein
MNAELTTTDLAGLIASIGAMAPAVDDSDRIERLRHFEALKSAISAAQATIAVEFDLSQRHVQAIAGVPAERRGRGVAAQIGLARRVSPWQGQRWLGWAKILTSELPATYAELAAGRTTEWRAMLVARETAVLTRADRATVDADLAPRLPGWGDRQVEAETRKAAYRLDPAAAVERARRAESDRRVGLRPAPDTMCWLSALLPVAQGVAAYASLTKAADSNTAGGDERGRGQLMADTLVQRLTGQASADAVPVEITLVMTDESLLRSSTANNGAVPTPAAPNDIGRGAAGGGYSPDGDEPAWLDGYGPVPAGWARDIACGAADDVPAGQRWIRRLYTRHRRPVALESTRRVFTPAQQRFLRLRDQTCRTLFCGAPIRHADHLQPHHQGGSTSTGNGQGLCQTCNHAKQAPGWRHTTNPAGVITTHTPTGHRYDSQPQLIGPPPRSPDAPSSPSSPVEQRLAALLSAA